MKKESVNTFNEGLNFDLNPITTPNNVLTDSVNGTFITFNGDELALQNDAGNTTIDYAGNPVALSEGFYPLGIKEYGGVLYIVSGKNPDIAVTLFNSVNIYGRGEVVFKTITVINGTTETQTDYYYESLVNYNDQPLPLESNAFWSYIGIKKDFINKYGYVEFGSYPSPEIIDSELFDTSLAFEIINMEEIPPEEFKFKLYSPQIINNSIFRAGVYVSFTHPEPIWDPLYVDNISFNAYDWENVNGPYIKIADSRKLIYKVKLYHQLTNGFIDLTEDVWLKYAAFVAETYTEKLNQEGVTRRYWFLDPDFKYYCPHNFKGKLVMSVELEELDLFRLNPISIELDGSTYLIQFNVDYVNYTTWNAITGAYTEPSYTLIFTLDGSEPNFATSIVTETVPLSFTVEIPIEYGGVILKYKLIPTFSYEGVFIPFEEFPQEFIDAHTISGNQLIASHTSDYLLVPDTSSYTCDGIYRRTERLVLMDGSGNYLNNLLEISPDPYYYYLEGTTEPTYWVGTYTVLLPPKASFTTNNALYPLTYESYFISLLQNTSVYEVHDDCIGINLTININKDMGIIAPIVVIQSGISIMATRVTNTQFIFKVKPSINFDVRPKSGLGFNMDSAYWLFSVSITEPEEISFGLITDLQIYVDPDAVDTIDCYYKTTMSSTHFGLPILADTGVGGDFTCNQVNPNYTLSGIGTSIIAGQSSILFSETPTLGEYPEFQIDFPTAILIPAANLSTTPVAWVETNHLFLASYHFYTIP